MLPLEGVTIWLPLFVGGAKMYYSLIVGPLLDHGPVGTVAALAALVLGWFIVMPTASITLGILANQIEDAAMRVGLGSSQYWKGNTLGEKVARELTRAALFLGSGALACVSALYIFPAASTLAPGKSLPLAYWGGLALWQVLLVAGVLALASIRSIAPGFLWFKGEIK